MVFGVGSVGAFLSLVYCDAYDQSRAHDNKNLFVTSSPLSWYSAFPFLGQHVYLQFLGTEEKPRRSVENRSARRPLDVYFAAEKAVVDSGSKRHFSLEQFVVMNGNELHLETSS